MNLYPERTSTRDAGDRLQDRIHQMIRDTGIHPTILDVSDEDFTEIQMHCYNHMRNPITTEWNLPVVFMSSQGETRIVKARK